MNENVKSCLAGGAGGMASVFTGHPFDTMKVKIQCHPTKMTMTQCFKTIMKESGPLGFYRGMATPLVLATPVSSLVFMGNDFAKKTFMPKNDSLAKSSICGFFAGSLSTLLACPGEQIKCILQNDPSFKSPVSATRLILSTSGAKGLFKGMLFTNLRDAPCYGVYFPAYRVTRAEFDKIMPEKMSMLMSGGVAGIAFWTVGMPADVMKSRLQTDTTGKYKTLKDVAVGVFKDGGVGAFYKGFTPTIMRSAPVNAVCFLFYELTINILSGV